MKRIVAIIVSVIAILAVALYSIFSHRENIRIDQSVREKTGLDYVKLSDGYTAYQLNGPDTGQVVVMIHGGTIPMCVFKFQGDAFAEAGYRVLLYDQYGRGESDRPKAENNRSLFKRQLSELLCSLDINAPVDLLGPSFGGSIAVTFASKFPERVRSIVLIAPVLNLPGSDSPMNKNLSLVRIPAVGRVIADLFLFNRLIKRGGTLVPGGEGSHCESQFHRQFYYKGTSRSMRSLFTSDAFGSYIPETKATGQLIQNILLIRGSLDEEVTPSMIEDVLGLLPNASFVEMEHIGHAPGAEAPERFNEIVLTFLSQINTDMNELTDDLH
ncbi:alpha/beta hydrolase [Chitinispirillales bacterium ANBcel5]|uniref:alpha/beta fold hydrolase n=1 Tax=Cellulosispirillum alkaliphilum TaxID=3039283 RepID=UPI002A573F77|nr:alpha/beta hydrolase [Chitinispirillales bacterium ANBcel5]